MPHDRRLSLFKRELAHLVKEHASHLGEATILATLEEYVKALANDLAQQAPPQPRELVEDSTTLLQESPRSIPLEAPTSDGEAQPSAARRAALLNKLKTRRANRRHRKGAPLHGERPRSAQGRTRAQTPAPGAAVVRSNKPAPRPGSGQKASEIFAQIRASHSLPVSPKREQFHAQVQGMLIARRYDFSFDVNHLSLPIQEQLLLDFDLLEPRAFEVLLQRSPLPLRQLLAALAALKAVGLIQLQLPGLGEARSSTGTELHRETVQRIEAMEQRLRDLNAFGIAGLHWTTYDVEIARRFKLLRAQFGHLNQPMGIEADYSSRLKSIRDQLATTHATLTDAKARSTLRSKSLHPSTISQIARSLEVIATNSVRQNNLRRALDACQRLLEIDPQHHFATRLLPSLLASASYR